jgi:hypothetical protein
MLMLGLTVCGELGFGGLLVNGAGIWLSCGGNETELVLGMELSDGIDVSAFEDGAALLLGALVMVGLAVRGLADVTSAMLGATLVEGADVDDVSSDGRAVFDVLGDGSDVAPMVDGALLGLDPKLVGGVDVDGPDVSPTVDGASVPLVVEPGDGAEVVVPVPVDGPLVLGTEGLAVTVELAIGAELVYGDNVVPGGMDGSLVLVGEGVVFGATVSVSLVLGVLLAEGVDVDPGTGTITRDGSCDGRVVGISERASLIPGEGAIVIAPAPVDGAAVMEDVEERTEGAGELKLVAGLVEGLDEVPASDDGALVVLGAGVRKVPLGIEVVLDPGPMDGISLGLGADIKEGDRVSWDWEGKNDDSIVDGVAETMSTGLGALIDGAKVIVPPPIDGASVMLGIKVPVPDDGVKLLLGAVVVASLEGDEVVGSAPVVDGASLVIKAVGADDGAVKILGAFDVNSVELGLELDSDVGKRDSDEKLDGRKEGVWELASLVLGEEELVVVGVEVVPDPVDGASLGAVLVEVKLVLGDDVLTSLGIGAELTEGDKVDPGNGVGRNCEGKLEGSVVGIRERVSLVLGAELSLVIEVVGADVGADSTILGEELVEEGNIDLDDGRREGRLVGVEELVSVLLGVGTTVLVPDPREGASLRFGAIVVEVGPDEDGTELWLGDWVLTSVLLGKVDGRRDGKGDGPCDGCSLLGEEVPEGNDVNPIEGSVEGSCDGRVDGIRSSCVGGSDGPREDVIRIDGNSDGILDCSVGSSDGPGDSFSLVASADGPCEGLSPVG